MILQALTKLYEDLAQRELECDKIPQFGYSAVSVSAIAQIDKTGNLISIIPANSQEPTKKALFILPLQLKRQGIAPPPYFLSDNAQYVFGLEKNGATEKSTKRFESFKSLHEDILVDDDCIEATALRNYLKKWDPNSPKYAKIIAEAQSFLFSGQIVFRILESASFLHDAPSVLQKWESHYKATLSEIIGTCLVTGKTEPIARIHNSVKGIRAKTIEPNGWTLVSFDKDSTAFSSYGKIQGYNAPVGEYAAFAYTAALNYLLADRNNVQLIGDTTVVCWAEGADPAYPAFSAAALFGQETPALTDNDLRAALKRLADGLPCPELGLDPQRPFYILGLAPNAARLSVRFFLRDTFGALMRNVNDHYERLEIVRPAYANHKVLSLEKLLQETAIQKTAGKSPSPALAGSVTRSIFSGTPYPVSLFHTILLRIHADQDEINKGKRIERKVTWERATILQAYLKKNIIEIRGNSAIEEVVDVKLNEQCTYLPYILGRLFSVMEQIQVFSADGHLNRTIKDGFFNAAATTPETAFAKLFPLNEHHMKKLMRDNPRQGKYYSKLKDNIISLIDEPIPKRFTQEESACFYLGYYHQTQKRYTKKEENEND